MNQLRVYVFIVLLPVVLIIQGMVKIIMDTKKPITGKNILVVEDIIDSGISYYLLKS